MKLLDNSVIKCCGECVENEWINQAPRCRCLKYKEINPDTIDPSCPLKEAVEVSRDLLIPLRKENDFDFTCRYGNIKFDDIEKIIIVRREGR